jgi:hypothetical protein
MNDADQLQRQSPAAGGRCSSHSFLEKIVMGDVYRNFVQAASAALLAIVAALPGTAMAQTVPAFHFESICRSDPGTNKNIVRLVLHGPDVDYQDGTFQQTHAPLAGVTINVLWSYVGRAHALRRMTDPAHSTEAAAAPAGNSPRWSAIA